MAFTRAKIRELESGVYLIDDAGESTCYLVCGREKAAVIDTANGYEDLREIVRSLTSLPLVVINTHGHGDHILGNVYFEEAYMHPADIPLAERTFSRAQEALAREGLKPCPLRPVEVGHVFDLGGAELEVVSLRGHTPGSIGLLDRQRRLLFSGDGMNPHLWMQLDHSLPIAALKETLVNLKRDFGNAFDRDLNGHAADYRPALVLDDLLIACGELLSGTGVDEDYTWFGGVCRQHRVGGAHGGCIVYTKDKL